MNRTGLLLGVASLGLLFTFSRPISWLFSETLEFWCPRKPLPAGDAQAIVVLNGPGVEERYRYAAWLYRNWRALPVLASVGRGHSEAAAQGCSAIARRVLVENGVPAGMIMTEDRSANTYEDSLFAGELLRDKGIRRIALVTEALHMLRAERAFRKRGFEVIPAPWRFRTAGQTFRWSDLLPSAKYARQCKDAVHEWVGIAWYVVKGYA